MKLMKTNNIAKPAQWTALLAASLFAISCTKGGTISGGGSTSSISGTISLAKTYPTASGSSWTPITASTRTYIKGLDLTVEGVCSRGIQTIKANEGGADYTETATCASDGSFSWSKSYTSGSGEGDKTLHFQAYDADGNIITGATASEDVRIDNTAPAIPVVTDPASTPYSYNGAVASYTILGTCAGDVSHITGPAGVNIACASGSWSYTAPLTAGATMSFSFSAWDLAGNQSGSFTQTILWSPTVIMYSAGAQSGGIVTDSSGASFTLEGTQDARSATSTDAFTSFSITTGFNYFINYVRGL